MILRQKSGYQICALFVVIFIINIQLAYQQKQQHSKDISFCVKNSTESTLKTFWADTVHKCPMDPYKLMDLYEIITNNISGESVSSKCDLLLSHQLRKSLVEASASIFEEGLIAKTFRNNAEVQRLSKRLSQFDSLVTQAVWELALDAVYLFVNKAELADMLLDMTNLQSKIAALLYLQSKYLARWDSDSRLLIKTAFFLSTVSRQSDYVSVPQELQKRAAKAYDNLSMQLRLLYSRSETKQLTLLNKKHWEFLYAPRENGPDQYRRTPLTWSETKNSTDSDGYLKVELRNDADVAFSSLFGTLPKHLYVDENLEPFFWIGDGTKQNRWWHVDWHDDYFTFTTSSQEETEKRLLCATSEYDENRRYVRLLSAARNMDLDACHWVLRPVV